MPTEPFLCVRNLTRAPILRDVSLSLESGHMLGVVGPSGAGKSTLARLIARLEKPDRGEILLEGRNLSAHARATVQLIFQQPAATLNPRFTAAEIVAEPLLIQRRGTRQERLETAIHWMEFAGLSPQAAHKPAHEFSGGERQRLAIARALAAAPKLLILDESLSGLHLSIQTQIAGFLRGQTSILISHDLALVARLADRIVVMDAGSVIEAGATDEIMSHPRHPRTRELLAASLALAGGSRA